MDRVELVLETPLAKAMLEAIAQEPEEMVNRLAYADLLEEMGESYLARFIRAQIQVYLLDKINSTFLERSKAINQQIILWRHVFDYFCKQLPEGISLSIWPSEWETSRNCALVKRGFIECIRVNQSFRGTISIDRRFVHVLVDHP